ncbi:hypothetical protein MMPV_009677 [Pyropia vietnamensis]
MGAPAFVDGLAAAAGMTRRGRGRAALCRTSVAPATARRRAPRMQGGTNGVPGRDGGGGGGGDEDVEARRARFRVTPVVDDPLARRTVGPKKVSKAAQSQDFMSFQDAWAAKYGRVVDVWAIIGVLFILVPPAVILWALSTGVIPGLV